MTFQDCLLSAVLERQTCKLSIWRSSVQELFYNISHGQLYATKYLSHPHYKWIKLEQRDKSRNSCSPLTFYPTSIHTIFCAVFCVVRPYTTLILQGKNQEQLEYQEILKWESLKHRTLEHKCGKGENGIQTHCETSGISQVQCFSSG